MGFYTKMKQEKEERRIREALASGGIRPKYKVLQADMLSPGDREKAAAVSSFITSGEDAYKLAGHDNFSYAELDEHRRRVGAVRYRGVEVKLLFRREVIEREPGPADPVPERVLKQPEDAWIQIDLLNIDRPTEQKGLSERLRQLMDQNNRLNTLYQSEQTDRRRAEFQLAQFKTEQTELKSLREKSGLQEKQLQIAEQEIERLKVAVRQQVEARKEDKQNMVRQLIPAFNTAWLAGMHRVGDTLYEIIRKQLTEGLQKIGIEVVDPAIGDEFDPQLHHAIHSYEFPTGAKEIESVVQVNRIGWKLENGPLIEAAEVAVGVEKKETENADAGRADVGDTAKVSGTD